MGQVDLTSGHAAVRGGTPGSNRNFGYTFAAVFLLLAVWQSWHAEWVRVAIFGSGAAIFLLLALLAPDRLSLLNRLWYRFGLLLHSITSPIILGLIFFVAITPTALLVRWLKKDSLRLRFEPAAASYWIVREPPGPPPDSFKNQF